MEFVFKTDEFIPKLNLLNKVISGKASLPILDSIKFNVVVKGDLQYIIATASDNDVFLQIVCNAYNVDMPFSFCVESKMITSVIMPLQGKDVKVTLDESTHTIKGEYKKGHFKVPYTDASDFPEPTNIDGTQDGEVVFSIGTERLANALALTKPFIADDTLRPQMCGVHLDFAKDSLTSVATDGQMLAKYVDRNITHDKDDLLSITIPEKPVGIVLSMLPKGDGDVKVIFNDRLLIVKNESFRLTTRLANGKYPNYNSVIPQETPISVKVDRAELLEAIKHIAPLGSATSQIMCINVNSNTLDVKADDIDFSTSGEETLECEHIGDEIKIGFKSSNLQQIIQNISSDKIVIGLTDCRRAGVFQYDGSMGDGIEYISIAMPMLMQ